MTSIFEFDVNKVVLDVTRHDYIATDKASGDEIPLPQGGNNEFLGQYPEIQAYLKAQYDIDVPLVYMPRQLGDTMNDDGHGVFQWVFRRTEATIIVNDISRPASSYEQFGSSNP